MLIILIFPFYFLGIVPWFLFNRNLANLGPGGSLVDHFPETYGDGSKIKWAHGTNERHILLHAIEGTCSFLLGFYLN